MKKVNKVFQYFICCFILYIYIFSPPLKTFSFGLDKIICFISIIYLFYKKKWRFVFFRFKKEWIYIVCISAFSFLITFLHGGKISLLMYDIFLLLEILPTSCALYIYIQGKKRFKIDEMLINISIFSALITVFLLFRPDIAWFLKTEILRFPEDLLERFYYRGYGFSDGLMFGYPVIQGFCVAFILINKEYKKYLWATVFMIVAIFSNARSGVVPIIIALGLLFKRYPLKLIKGLILFLVFILISSPILKIIINNNEILSTSLEWGMTTFNIISDLLQGKEAENFDALLGDMVVWPQTLLEWLIGCGYTLRNTDVGYFIRLNYGGIFYLIVWFIFIIYLFTRLYKNNNKIAVLLFMSLLFLNYKADFFVINPSSRFFFLVYVIWILNAKYFDNKETLQNL